MGEVRDELRRLAETIRVGTQHGVERRRKTGNLVAAGAIGLVVLWFLVALLGLIEADPRYGSMRRQLQALEKRVEALAKEVRGPGGAAASGQPGARRGARGKAAARRAPAGRAAADGAAADEEASADRGPSGGRFVRVTQDSVNIRGEPDLGAVVIGQAAAGDVFELEREVGDWYSISMFSGDERYLSSKLVEVTGELPPLPRDNEVRLQLCGEVLEARKRAADEASSRRSENSIERFETEKRLSDRYVLEAYRRHGVAPARSRQVSAFCSRAPGGR